MSNIVASPTLRPDMPFAMAARETLAAQLATLFVWAAFLPQSDRVHEHHQMRIAAKRLRYSLDAFVAILPAGTETVFEDLKALQTELGTLHDLDTLFLAIERAMMQGTSSKRRKRNEATRTRQAKQRASLELFLSATAAERDAQHRRCLHLWHDLTQRDAFAPVQRAITVLAALAAPTPPKAEAACQLPHRLKP
jgi:hypothetical protein